MTKILPILLMIYIISPLDAFPNGYDDLIAAAFLVYTLYKNSKIKKQARQQTSYSSGGGEKSTKYEKVFDLGEAYRTLGTSPDSSLEDISKAYKEKMSGSHPDKVNHLSKELQEKAQEITLKLNRAYEMIKESRVI